MDCEYFIKESDVHHLEQIQQHDKLKIFYADNGTVMNSKGKYKPCIIAENIAGVYFYYKKVMRHQFQLKHFISIYDIIEIKYVDSKKRILKTKVKEINFTADHPDRVVSKLLSARSCLFDQLPDLNPIKISTFPKIPTISRGRPAEKDLNISVLRYICQCLRVDEKPIKSMIDILNKIDKRTNHIITIDDNIRIMSNLHALSDPIAPIKNVSTICLRKISPYIACALAHLFLKTSISIKTFIFDGFSFLIPHQLKLAKMTKIKRPISLIFEQCSFDDRSFQSLLKEFCQFPGEFQRISFNNISFTSNMFDFFIDAIPKFRSIRTLELLEFNQVSLYDELNEEKLNSLISLFLKHCRFLCKISFTFKTKNSKPFPVQIQMDNFLNYSILGEISICDQDLTQQFTNSSMKLPSNVHLLDFSRCTFSIESIQGLFGLLSEYENPLSLTLADATFSNSDWPQLFEMLSSLQPLKCISELDWSGNKIPKDQIDTFCNLFIDPEVFRFLSIDRIFNSKNINELNELLSSVSKVKKLWGISVGGDSGHNFCGSSFSNLLSSLKTIMPFHSLHIEGQTVSEPDLIMLVDFLNENDQICELSSNGAMIQNERSFFGFFAELLRRTGVRAISRPIKNVELLIDKNKKSGNNSSFDEEWENFRSNIIDFHNVASKSIRSMFFSKIEEDKNEIEKYFKFVDSFPTSFIELGEYDPLMLDYCAKDVAPVSSIHQIELETNNEPTMNEKLDTTQSKLLHSPFEAPLDF